MLSREAGFSREYLYMGFANSVQGVFEIYGRENVQALREVSARFDPRGVFQRKVPGGFKIPF